MTPKPKSVAFRLPEELIQAIDLNAKTTGRDRTSVVIQALKQVFQLLPIELPLADTVIREADTRLEEQLKELPELKNRINELEKKVTDLTERIAELNQPTLLDSSTIQQIAALSEHLINLVAKPSACVQQIEEVKPQTTDIVSSHYVQIDNFLSMEEGSRLLDYVIQQESAFAPTNTSTGDSDYRRSIILHSFPEFSELIVNRIQSIIPGVLSKLELSPFFISQIETQLTAHNDGNYYKVHNDNGSLEAASRELSYVYYFHRQPKPFSGGELLIYDSKIENNFYVAAESFKTVEPRNNSIVFFLSRYMHEILPVSCPSQAFADSRFTINGWVRR